MLTRCSSCRTKIPFGQSLCTQCLIKRRKENKDNLKSKDAEKHTKTARWQKTRKDVLVRDKGVCQLCLVRGQITNKKLEVHHIKKRSEVIGTAEEYLIYDHSNLVTVCRKCHEELEVLSISKQKELLKWNKDDDKGIEFYL